MHALLIVAAALFFDTLPRLPLRGLCAVTGSIHADEHDMRLFAAPEHDADRFHKLRKAAIWFKAARYIGDDLLCIRKIKPLILQHKLRTGIRAAKVHIDPLVNDVHPLLIHRRKLRLLPLRRRIADIARLQIYEMMRIQRAQAEHIVDRRLFIRPPCHIRILGMIIPFEIANKRYLRINVLHIERRSPARMPDDHIGAKFDLLLHGNSCAKRCLPI